MSAATKQALEDALCAHITDEQGEGRVVTEWILLAGGVSPGLEADERDIWYEDSDMPAHHHLGLIDFHMIQLRHAVATA